MPLIKPHFTSLSFLTALFIGAFCITASAHAVVRQPNIDSATFSTPTVIDHPYFTPVPGQSRQYRSKTSSTTKVFEIPGDTKRINGIDTVVYHEKELTDGKLTTETYHFLAADDDGNIWYLGAEVNTYIDGELTDHTGSWSADEAGVLPGYWLPKPEYLNKGFQYRHYKLSDDVVVTATVVTNKDNIDTALGEFVRCLTISSTRQEQLEPFPTSSYCAAADGLVRQTTPLDTLLLTSIIRLPEVPEAVTTEPTDNEDIMRALRYKLLHYMGELVGLFNYQIRQ